MRKRAIGKFAWWVVTLNLAAATASGAPTLTTLVSFSGGVNGAYPQGTLIQATDGNLYGTTGGGQGEGDGNGTVFKITPGGTLTTLYSFCTKSGCPDGSNPSGGLVEGTDGNFYGTASTGGAHDGGTVFKITVAGVLTTLYSFCAQTNCADGENPDAPQLLLSGGYFYGTTQRGGLGSGTVFKINAGGTLTTLHSFCSETNCADGGTPTAGVIQGSNGNLYGETDLGGANHQGTLYEISKAGVLKTLYTFCSQNDCADGSEPIADPIQASDGNFYGTTSGLGGGSTASGTVFRLTPSGTLTTLHVFDGSDGSRPYAPMIQATDGNLYGTTWVGGVFGDGTIFKIALDGTLTTLYDFCSKSACADGELLFAGLEQDTSGEFYGVTENGGTGTSCLDSCGTVFSFDAGLGPFIVTEPTGGTVNTKVAILGGNLTGTTGVTFNGTAAAFKVLSDTEIVTRVPAGATSGTVQVATPAGSLKSNKPFQVLK